MAIDIKQLAPTPVWSYFYDLTQIPRPTAHTKATQEYILSVASRLGLDADRDATGNIVVRKPATSGREHVPIVTLQAHLDMVPQKNSTTQHDFLKDAIDAYVDGEWVRARGTTLGADNGIGVAYALSILESSDVQHGPIEALFTVDEEVGMVGANGLQEGFIKGKILVNIDSEDHGVLFVGCAGALDGTAHLEYQDTVEVPTDDIAVRVSLTGLKGGHSGLDIVLGRANANKLMVRFLKEAIQDHGACISSLEGGSLRNAIPREAFATLTIPAEEADGLWELASDYQDLYSAEYAHIEDGLRLSLERIDLPRTIVPEEIQDNVINALEASINGVISMQVSFPGTVESSLNMARVWLGEGRFETKYLIRSSVESRKWQIASSIESLMALADIDTEFSGHYNGWNPNIDSPILLAMKQAYQEALGIEPKVEVVHAGLECGIIQGVMPEMDMISIGPDIRWPHSPDECVRIQSVADTWLALCRVLELVK